MQKVQLVIGDVMMVNVYQIAKDVMVKWIVMMAVMNLTAVSHVHVYNHLAILCGLSAIIIVSILIRASTILASLQM